MTKCITFSVCRFYPDLTPTSTLSVARVAIFQSREVRRKNTFRDKIKIKIIPYCKHSVCFLVSVFK